MDVQVHQRKVRQQVQGVPSFFSWENQEQLKRNKFSELITFQPLLLRFRHSLGNGSVGLRCQRVCRCVILPGLGSKQLIIVRGSLVVILPVSDHSRKTFADKSLGNVAVTENMGQ